MGKEKYQRPLCVGQKLCYDPSARPVMSCLQPTAGGRTEGLETGKNFLFDSAVTHIEKAQSEKINVSKRKQFYFRLVSPICV
jgi:hypothetical protein